MRRTNLTEANGSVLGKMTKEIISTITALSKDKFGGFYQGKVLNERLCCVSIENMPDSYYEL
jgi:hypothetical protein